MFANAGVAKYAPFGTITEELYDSIFDVNVKGLLFTVQKALPLMPDGASIILNASSRRQQRAAREQCLYRDESRRAVVRAHLDHRLEEPPHPRERGEPGLRSTRPA